MHVPLSNKEGLQKICNKKTTVKKNSFVDDMIKGTNSKEGNEASLFSVEIHISRISLLMIIAKLFLDIRLTTKPKLS